MTRHGSDKGHDYHNYTAIYSGPLGSGSSSLVWALTTKARFERGCKWAPRGIFARMA